MKEFLRRIKADFMLSSVLCIVLGLIFIFYKEATIDFIGMVIAIGMIAIGAIYLCSFFLNLISNGFSVALGAIILMMGVWIFIQPSIVVTFIPIVIGVILIGHGMRGFKESWDAKKYGYSSWAIGMLLSVISMVFGVICIVHAFGIVQMASVAIGIALIYNGVSNLYIAIAGTKAEKNYRSKQDPIDIEFKE